MARAGFFARFVAFLLDNIALSLLAWAPGALIAPLFAGIAATGIPILCGQGERLYRAADG